MQTLYLRISGRETYELVSYWLLLDSAGNKFGTASFFLADTPAMCYVVIQCGHQSPAWAPAE